MESFRSAILTWFYAILTYHQSSKPTMLPVTTPSRFDPPPGSTDCHVHAFDPACFDFDLGVVLYTADGHRSRPDRLSPKDAHA